MRFLARLRGTLRHAAQLALAPLSLALLANACAKKHAPREPSSAQVPAASSRLANSARVANPAAPFVSFNVPTLHYIEDDWRFTSMLRYRLPNEFEIHDALQSVVLMGGAVIRIYTLSVRKPTDTPEVVRHVLGPGKFNEEAFATLDRVLANAAELGVRIILPFVDNWSHWGGVAEYAAFRGKPRQAFFTDPELIADFERTIEHLLTRVNTVNGRQYRSDPTIFAWETGNELSRPDNWVSRIAHYIKQLDSTHAVIDGTYGAMIREQSINEPNVDIVSSHHYDPAVRTLAAIDANLRLLNKRKRYLIGEFGMLTASDTEQVLRHALMQPVEGVLLWSLRYHNRDGGYYHHMEKAPFQAYHFPGSILGHDYEEQAIIRLMRNYAFTVRHQEAPELPVPAAPNMLPASSLGEVRWRGSVGARYYVVERQIGAGIWEIVASRVDEAQTPYRPGFVDDTAPMAAKVRYRVIAANETGLSEPSLPTEEVHVTGRLMVDEMSRPQLLEKIEGPASFTTEHAELCKMDATRLRGQAGARACYPIKGRAVAVRLFAFVQDAGKAFELSSCSKGRAFKKLITEEQSFAGAADEPVALRPVLISSSAIPPMANEICIGWLQTAEIGRVELQLVPHN